MHFTEIWRFAIVVESYCIRIRVALTKVFHFQVLLYFNQYLSPLMLWVQISIRARCTTLCDKVYQWLATGRWFSPGPPVSSTNKTDRRDITEILLKVALSPITLTPTADHTRILSTQSMRGESESIGARIRRWLPAMHFLIFAWNIRKRGEGLKI